MDDAVLKTKFNAYDEQIKALEKKNEELERKIEKLECKAGFARAAELERIEKEREEELKEAGMTKEEFLEQSKAPQPTKADIVEGVERLVGQVQGYLDEGKIDEEQANKLYREVGEHAMTSLARIELDKDVLEDAFVQVADLTEQEEADLKKIYTDNVPVQDEENCKKDDSEEEEIGGWFDNKKEKAWFE